ncbi:MAG: hypothetical protein ACRDPW_07770 [Mycobacteriales bacterium]
MIRRFHIHIGVACALIGTVIWAITVAITTPAAGRAEAAADATNIAGLDVTDLTGDQLHLWAQELREAAILLAAGGLLFAIHRFRGAALISAVTGAALLVGDLIIDAQDGSGVRLTISIAAGACLLGLLVFGFAQNVDDHSDRNHQLTLMPLAVVAAYCAPALFSHTPTQQNAEFIPIGLTLGTAIIAAALAALAGFSVLAYMKPQPRTGVATCIVAVPAAAMGAASAVAFSADLGEVATYAPALGLPLAAAAVLLMCGPGSKLRRLGSRVAFFAGAVLLAVPVALFALVPAQLVGEKLMNAAGYDYPADGLAYFPGVFLVALALGFLSKTVNLTPATSESEKLDSDAREKVSRTPA